MDARALLGAEIAGRYLLRRHLGDGPLGATFEASTPDSPPLAVKVVARSLLSDESLSRYLQAAPALSAIRNVHLIAARDVAYDLPRRLVVFARDLLVGPDLAAFLASNGPLAPLTALRVVAQACDGVASAHAIDLLHRNVKPSNVFLESDDAGRVTVRVCDPGVWGGATVRSRGEAWEHLRYSSPEAVSSSKDLDQRADVFSLAAVLYALITGTPPHAGAPSAEALASREVETIQSQASWVSPTIARVVDQALSRDPARRFASAQTLAAALRELAGGDDSVTRAELLPLDPSVRATKAAPASSRPVAQPGGEISPGPERDPLLGHRLGGRFRVLRALGRGGMGAVYEVEGATGEHFAAKVISRDAAGRDTQIIARFIREAHSITRIDDPHVTRTIELGTDMTLGVPFLVMDLLHGRDVGSLFKERGAIEPVPLLRLFAQAARGLSAAHKQGLVHRDVKPANIFLDTAHDGTITVKICDFGLAKALEQREDDGAAHELTRSGGLLGTPMYMSPEHATNPREVDARADIWSLCASLYEGLSGQKLWANVGQTTAELMLAICTRSFRPLAEVAPWVSRPIAEIVERGLALLPEERWPDVDSIIAALSVHIGGKTAVSTSELVSVDPARLGTRTTAGPSSAPTRQEGVAERGEGAALQAIPRSESALTRPPPRRGFEETPQRSLRLPAPEVVGARTRWSRIAAAGGVTLVALGVARVASHRPSTRSSTSTMVEAAAAAPADLAGPNARLACPIFEVRGIPDVAVRLGAAGATLACTRAKWYVGGSSDRVAPPAALLDIPRQPVDQLADPYTTVEARWRTEAMARSNGDAVLQGVANYAGTEWTVDVSVVAGGVGGVARSRGTDSLYLKAVAKAVDGAWARQALPRRPVDLSVARWTSLANVEMGLAYEDFSLEGLTDGCPLVLRGARDLGLPPFEFEETCASYAPDLAPDAAARPAPILDESSSWALVASAGALVQHGMNLPMDERKRVAGRLDELARAEVEAIGRAALEFAAGEVWWSAREPDRAHTSYLLAVRDDPLHLDAWNRIIAAERSTTRNTPVASAWFPCESSFLTKAKSLRGDELQDRLRETRLAYMLEPDMERAMYFGRALAESGDGNEVSVVAATPLDDEASNRALKSYLTALVDLHSAKLGAAIKELENAGNIGMSDLVVVAEVAGRLGEVSTRWARRFMSLPDERVDGTARGYDGAIALCMSAEKGLATRCVNRVAQLGHASPNWWGEGGEDFLSGAIQYAAGNSPGAAERWRTLVAGSNVTIARLLPTAAFEAAGLPDLAERLDERKMPYTFIAGVSDATPRQAARAFARGDARRGRELAQSVVRAWEVADLDAPAVAPMRAALRNGAR